MVPGGAGGVRGGGGVKGLSLLVGGERTMKEGDRSDGE